MRKKRILVLDDEAGLTRLLKINLEDTGRYEVRVENHGRRALAAAVEFRPDLILLDLVMPDMPGEAVLDAIRSRGEFQDVPVLLLTASAGDRSRRLEGLPWITKPVRTVELIDHIEGHLA